MNATYVYNIMYSGSGLTSRTLMPLLMPLWIKFHPASRSVVLQSCPCPASRHRRCSCRFSSRWRPQTLEEAGLSCFHRRVGRDGACPGEPPARPVGSA